MNNWIVYIIHFNEKYKHSQHYIGMTNNFIGRMKKHLKGYGGRLPYVVAKAGIGMRFFKIEENLTAKEARYKERQYKKRKNSYRFCPICKGKNR